MINRILYFLSLIIIISCSDSSTDDSHAINESLINQTSNNSSDSNNNNDQSISNQNSKNDSQSSYDRSKMLEFTVEKIIIPAFDDLEAKLTEFKGSYRKFNSDMTNNNLDDLRNKWLLSYKAWQHVEMYDIGKAMEDYYAFKGNVYPVDTVRVKINIEKGEYDLNNPNNYDAQGFPTIDYLLYGLDKEMPKIIDHFKNDQKISNYLGKIIDELISSTSSVNSHWKSTKGEFIKSIENSATSNLNMLINDFIFYYEKRFRANKFGIPGGVFSSSALPDRVEGFYSKIYSKELAQEAFTSIKNFFNGISHENKDVIGTGVKSYLDFLDPNKTKLLSDDINNQFTIAENSISELNDNFSLQIKDGLIKLLTTYDDIQKAVVLLKVDMLQILNINVDYVDADGD
ncbi:MAG: imelysin family protein [Bacteroidota bacterium]|nr:imelysin family protein [Bacteroidota bacterium]